jgi:hypothetical protein
VTGAGAGQDQPDPSGILLLFLRLPGPCGDGRRGRWP